MANKRSPDLNVLYDALVFNGILTDSQQRDIESGNTTYIANRVAHRWAKPAAKSTPAAPASAPKASGADAPAKKDATSDTTAPIVK